MKTNFSFVGWHHSASRRPLAPTSRLAVPLQKCSISSLNTAFLRRTSGRRVRTFEQSRFSQRCSWGFRVWGCVNVWSNADVSTQRSDFIKKNSPTFAAPSVTFNKNEIQNASHSEAELKRVQFIELSWTECSLLSWAEQSAVYWAALCWACSDNTQLLSISLFGMFRQHSVTQHLPRKIGQVLCSSQSGAPDGLHTNI
jgi:hypothetical protein